MRGGVCMDTYEVLVVMLMFGTFLIALLSYINKK
ncbi:putative holin-like toxin [Chakrabartyella piscis]|nr:putative holin-like toxin [Chakrabartyella piscis]